MELFHSPYDPIRHVVLWHKMRAEWVRAINEEPPLASTTEAAQLVTAACGELSAAVDSGCDARELRAKALRVAAVALRFADGLTA